MEEEAYGGCIQILDLYEKERNFEASAQSSPALKSPSSSSSLSSLHGAEGGANVVGATRWDAGRIAQPLYRAVDNVLGRIHAQARDTACLYRAVANVFAPQERPRPGA